MGKSMTMDDARPSWVEQQNMSIDSRRNIMNNLKDILDRLNSVEEKNGVYWANCPCHNDTEQSLMVMFDNGKPEMACSSCGATTKQVMGVLEKPETDAPEIVARKAFKRLDEFTEETANWLIPGWIPEGQITLLAADGGLGKTTLWTHIVAAISSGRRCIMDAEDYHREPGLVAFFSAEDDVSKKLYRKLVDGGANLKNIITMDFSGENEGLQKKFKFGSPELAEFIRSERPKLCVFDPIQGFLPAKVNMGSRNEMRDCLAPLITLGAETGTTFLLICHTNKRKGASDRSRISDSADLWDIARSVLMMGYTEEDGIRYLSHEKTNYGDRQQTILYSINNKSEIVREGTTGKRDREYMSMTATERKPNRLESCKKTILKILTEAPDRIMRGSELNAQVRRYGHTEVTCNRARRELCEDGHIRNDEIYVNGKKGWYTRLCADHEPVWEELPPFDRENVSGQSQA